MSKHTEIVNAYIRMVQLQENELYAASRNNRSRALSHEAEANAWKKASDLLIDEASEDEQQIMQQFYRDSECLPLREKLAEVRRNGAKEGEVNG